MLNLLFPHPSLSFTGGELVGAGIGFVVGAFTPAVGRKIKSFIVGEAAKAVIALEKQAGPTVNVVPKP